MKIVKIEKQNFYWEKYFKWEKKSIISWVYVYVNVHVMCYLCIVVLPLKETLKSVTLTRRDSKICREKKTRKSGGGYLWKNGHIVGGVTQVGGGSL